MPEQNAALPPDGPLPPVVARRDALDNAATSLEGSLAHASHTEAWRVGVQQALTDAGKVLDQHIEDMSGSDGLPSSVVQVAPRLVGQADRLEAEHGTLLTQQRSVYALAQDGATEPDILREAAADLVATLRRHVRHANDLLVDAVEEELGGGD